MVPSDYDFDKVITASEDTAKSCLRLEEQMKQGHDRFNKLESGQEAVIKKLNSDEVNNTVSRETINAHHRVLYGENDAPGLLGIVSRLQIDLIDRDKQIARIKGMLYVIGGFAVVVLPTLITFVIAFLKHILH